MSGLPQEVAQFQLPVVRKIRICLEGIYHREWEGNLKFQFHIFSFGTHVGV
jgi:hypothetical protein